MQMHLSRFNICCPTRERIRFKMVPRDSYVCLIQTHLPTESSFGLTWPPYHMHGLVASNFTRFKIIWGQNLSLCRIGHERNTSKLHPSSKLATFHSSSPLNFQETEIFLHLTNWKVWGVFIFLINKYFDFNFKML